MNELLSPKLNEFLNFIQRFTLLKGQAPSYKEIMSSMGFGSLGTVNWYVKTLEGQGFLSRIKGPNGKRALVLTHKEHATATITRLPLLGLVAAGEPIEALENPEMIDIPPSLIHPDNYVLQVKGDSMVEAGINDGDTVIVKKASNADNGEIAVVLIDEQEATLKRIRKKGNTIALEAANKNYDTKIYAANRIKIQGKLVSLYRNFH